MDSLVSDCKFVRHSNAVAAGQTDITPAAGIDCTGFGGVLFVVEFGAIVATSEVTIKAQESTDDGAVDTYADIAGTAVTVADTDDGKVFILDVKPRSKWAKCVVTRATENATLEGITAILYDARYRGAVLNRTTSGPSAVIDGASFTNTQLGSTVGGAKSVTLKARGTA